MIGKFVSIKVMNRKFDLRNVKPARFKFNGNQCIASFNET